MAKEERTDGGFYTIVDESGTTVYITGRGVKVGDQCLTEKNKRYEVVALEGDIAKARYLGEVDLSQYLPNRQQGFFAYLQPAIVKAADRPKVAIYHTHSDESYIPTDGKESIDGKGGIYKVGDSFAAGLEKNNIQAIHVLTNHDPHDDMAYERSRRTVADLLKNEQPDALFDVHRDAVPPQVYSGNINGQEVTKVQLVVGKYGPTAKQIEDYALQIKANADNKYPGLVKGIFFAKGGDYNEDLNPRSMLLEVGAHTNSREQAERGIALFADVVPTILGKTGANQPGAGVGTAETGASGASKSTIWIIGLVLVGGGVFLILSTGGLKEASAKLKQFTSTEFANFFNIPDKKTERKTEDKSDLDKTKQDKK